LRAQRERVRSRVERFLVFVHDQLDADFARVAVAKLDHFRKFVARVDVQQRKRNFPRIEGLLRQAQHHRRIFSDGIQHHRARKFRRRLAKNLDALRLQSFQVVQRLCGNEPGPLVEARSSS